jgi:hypothetical protein
MEKREKMKVFLCHKIHWWLEVHMGGMVEKCIVSIYLRPCKQSGCPPILVFGEAMCSLKMRLGCKVPTPDERILTTVFNKVG